MSNIVLIKAIYTCFEKVHSRGLSGRRKVVGVLFLSLLLHASFAVHFSVRNWKTAS